MSASDDEDDGDVNDRCNDDNYDDNNDYDSHRYTRPRATYKQHQLNQIKLEMTQSVETKLVAKTVAKTRRGRPHI